MYNVCYYNVCYYNTRYNISEVYTWVNVTNNGHLFHYVVKVILYNII